MTPDYAVADREVLAEVLADYADARVPYVTDNPDRPVPFALTPAADAELDTWTGPAPDPAETAVARDAWAKPSMDADPEADPELEPDWEAEWDDAESSAYHARLEAETEAEAG